MVARVSFWYGVGLMSTVMYSTYSMLRHLPGSFPQRRPILRYALDTYYGCLQSSYICGYKGTIVFPVALLANVFKTADFSAGNMTWSSSCIEVFWVYILLVANDDGAEYRHVWRTSGWSSFTCTGMHLTIWTASPTIKAMCFWLWCMQIHRAVSCQA
ncbi:uncharacterized protein LOC126874333 isoform X5 [Bombus huntii]|uniref:uncharacterized protein LOC126874333 isoform X5 n=1 Tax=Bombus huntii TaxID=85661 RepID=UPI0021AA4C2C|nr:uncharacterized protein LOC126874333 isoform X5 [Bombus huntii]